MITDEQELERPTIMQHARGPAVDALVALAWLAVGLLVAAGLGPWLSQVFGTALPAFALVCTTRPLRARCTDLQPLGRPE